MFGLDITVLAFIGLVGLSVGGILFALLFTRVETERNQDRRINTIKTQGIYIPGLPVRLLSLQAYFAQQQKKGQQVTSSR